MQNYIQPGNTITLVADANYSSGQPIVIGDIIGICSADVLNGAEVEVALVGVFDLAKDDATGSGMDQGDPVYWNASSDIVEGDSTGNTLMGVCVADAADSDVLVRVRLNGSFA